MSEVSAYHEAGHALMAIVVGARVRSVTIDPDWDDGPSRHADTQVEWPVDEFEQPEFCEKSVQVALAGPVAEMIYTGDPFHPGLVSEWAGDWKTAWQAAESIIPADRKRLSYLEQSSIQLHSVLSSENYWEAIAAIADELLAHETLEGHILEQIVDHWLP